jgi:hypothetical protein
MLPQNVHLLIGLDMGGNPLDETKRFMGALGRMPPKPHKEMKLGKAKGRAKP